MKTEQQLKTALTKYESELATIKERLDWTISWLDAANFVQNQELFVAQVKERDELQKREADMDFKIRFVKWVLETKD